MAITKSISVTDICPSVGTGIKTCQASVSGDTSFCSYSVKGGGTQECCSSVSSCIKTEVCPYVFSSVNWDNEIEEGGTTYELTSTSGGANSSSASATYEEKADEVEISVTHHFGSLTVPGTITATVGERINPSSLAMSRDGWSLDYTVPASTFTVTVSTTSIDLYYTEDLPTYFTLTINYRLSKNGIIVSTKTVQKLEGTTINPATETNNYLPDNYEIISYEPATSFKMTSDETIEVVVRSTGQENVSIIFYNINIFSYDSNFYVSYIKDGTIYTNKPLPIELQEGESIEITNITSGVTDTYLDEDLAAWSSSKGTINDVSFVKEATNIAVLSVSFSSTNRPILTTSSPSLTITYSKQTKTIDAIFHGIDVGNKWLHYIGGSSITSSIPIPHEIKDKDTSYQVFYIAFECTDPDFDSDPAYWSVSRGEITRIENSSGNTWTIGINNLVLDYDNPTVDIYFEKILKSYTYSLSSNISDIDEIYIVCDDKLSSELQVGTDLTFTIYADKSNAITFETSENLTYEDIELVVGNKVYITPTKFDKVASGSKYKYTISFFGDGNYKSLYDDMNIVINKILIKQYAVNLLYFDEEITTSYIDDDVLMLDEGTTVVPEDYIKTIVGYNYKYCSPSAPFELTKITTIRYYYEKLTGKRYKVNFKIENINDVEVNCRYEGILKDTYSFVGTTTIAAHTISEIEQIVSTEEMEDIAMNLVITAIFTCEGYNDSQEVIANATYTPIE